VFLKQPGTLRNEKPDAHFSILGNFRALTSIIEDKRHALRDRIPNEDNPQEMLQAILKYLPAHKNVNSRALGRQQGQDRCAAQHLIDSHFPEG